jgi:MFS transporter, OFA family, oxalate/formate antiporter
MGSPKLNGFVTVVLPFVAMERPQTSPWIYALLGCSITMLFGLFNSFGVLLKPLEQTMGWSRLTISVAFSLYTWVYSLSTPVMGWLDDRVGPRAVYALGAGLIGAGLLLASSARTAVQFDLAFGVIAASGAGALWAPTLSNVTKRFHGSAAQWRATTLVVMGNSLGFLFFPPLVGIALRRGGWRVAMAAMALYSASVLAVAAVAMGRPRSDAPLFPAPRGGFPWPAFRRPAFRYLFIAYASFSATITLVMAHFPAHAQDHGLPEATSTFTISLVGLGSLVGQSILGLGLTRVIESRKLVAACALLQALLLSAAPLMTGEVGLISFPFGFGVLFGGMLSQFPALVGQHFGPNSLGTVMGAVFASYGVGGVVGPALGGFAFEHFGTYAAAFLIAAACAALSGAATLSAGRPERHHPTWR